MLTRSLLTLLFATLSLSLSAQDGATIYATYCAGCHGAHLQGNSASRLIKTEWKYGRGRDAIFRNIKHGIAGTEMIAWSKALKDEEIRAVAKYIVSMQTVPLNERRPIPAQLTTADYKLSVEQIVTTGLSKPWGIEFVDNNRALISERSGGLRWLVGGKLDPERIRGVPATFALPLTGGFFDIALDPDYGKNGWVYLAYSHRSPTDSLKGMTKISRAKIQGHQWMQEQTLFEVPDSLNVKEGNRWGGRLMFDKSGDLYFSIGDMGRGDDSQHPWRPEGKVFRIKPDGSIPNDNPFAKDKANLKAIYSLGNRNVQGMAEHPVTGDIWMTEHGPMGGDEVNILTNGANYGWPVITYGIDYSGAIVSNETHMTGMEQPVLQWTPSIAVCPAIFVSGKGFPKWQNNLLVGALAFEEIRRLTIKDHTITGQEVILKGVGRVRDLKISPDGALWVVLNDPDVVLRVMAGK